LISLRLQNQGLAFRVGKNPEGFCYFDYNEIFSLEFLTNFANFGPMNKTLQSHLPLAAMAVAGCLILSCDPGIQSQ
jgi:hypothetical protein